jgi:hypothetical protein
LVAALGAFPEWSRLGHPQISQIAQIIFLERRFLQFRNPRSEIRNSLTSVR